ncbi:MAG: hypothetical protein ACRDZ3_18435 [Acidimicrobiia bacterium]
MGVQRTSFEKLQRERQKKAKAAAKRARREEKGTTTEAGVDIRPETADGQELKPLSPAELLHMVQVVHERFEAGKIDLEEFEEKKTELLARLPVD